MLIMLIFSRGWFFLWILHNFSYVHTTIACNNYILHVHDTNCGIPAEYIMTLLHCAPYLECEVRGGLVDVPLRDGPFHQLLYSEWVAAP